MVRFPSWTSANYRDAAHHGCLYPLWEECNPNPCNVNTQQGTAQSHLCTLQQRVICVFLLNWFPFLPGKLYHIHQPFLYLGLAIQQFCGPLVLLKKLPINAGDVRGVGFDPRLGRTLEEGMQAIDILTWRVHLDRGLEGCSPQGHRESEMTEAT